MKNLTWMLRAPVLKNEGWARLKNANNAHTTFARFEFKRFSSEDDDSSRWASRIRATTLSRVSRFANGNIIMMHRKQIDDARDEAYEILNSFIPSCGLSWCFHSVEIWHAISPFLLSDADSSQSCFSSSHSDSLSYPSQWTRTLSRWTPEIQFGVHPSCFLDLSVSSFDPDQNFWQRTFCNNIETWNLETEVEMVREIN